MKLRIALVAAVLALAGCNFPGHAAAQPNAQRSQALTVDSPIGLLMDNARTRPVMDRHMPNLASNPHFNMIRDWPLRRLATDPHARGLTMEKLNQIATDLAAAQR
jgi:hypothetical protein